MSSKRRIRDFQQCVRNIKSFSDSQAKINKWDEDHLGWVEVSIRPSDGFYKGGIFKFMIFFEDDFPKCPPRVECLTPIYHPNIDTTCDDHNVCLNLFDEWDDRYSLEDIIQGLLFLLYNPNVDDPLSSYFTLEMSDEELQQQIRQSLNGGNMDGVAVYFPENNHTEVFDEAQLTRGIELILQKASTMVVQEVNEEEGPVEEEYQDSNELHENNNNVEYSCDDGSPLYNFIINTEPRYEKNDLLCALRHGLQVTDISNNYARSLGKWTSYIPRVIIPTQFDPFIEIILMCIGTLTR